MIRTDLQKVIEKELSNAETAMREGNDGRARACARRAVGFLLSNVSNLHSLSGIERLRRFAADESYPASIRQASLRLTTNVKDRLSPDFTWNPIGDAKKILAYFAIEIK